MRELKQFIKLNVIPTIMMVISAITAFVTNANIRKLLLIIQCILLGVHAIRCLIYIEKLKRGE